MISVQLNKRDFEYDIHSLVKAFYPGMEVCVYCRGEKQAAGSDLDIFVDYETDRIEMKVVSGAGNLLMQEAVQVEYDKDRKETKNHLKRLIYHLLSRLTGQELPWGCLTGIRPTKIVMGLLDQGMNNARIAEHMRKTYLTSNGKTALSIMIANRERHILRNLDYQKGYSLYIGIPFCPSICLYCSFSSSPIDQWKNRVEEYLEALFREIAFGAEEYRGHKLDTVYIGGGTPTTLEPEQLDRLLNEIEKHFDLSKVQEFTIEAGRPDSITWEKLKVIKSHPVTRISINPQTMNQQTLDIIGRKHTAEQTAEAYFMARQLEFDNINMDLIIGLPGEDKAEVEYTLKEVVKLVPDSITAHSLAVKRAARLRMFKDQYQEMTFLNSREIMDMVSGYMRAAGMYPYYLYRQKNMAGNFENVGYAKEDRAGIYNILIMEEMQSILALGAGAATKIVLPDRIERIENVKDIKSYIERIDEMIERKRQGFVKYGK